MAGTWCEEEEVARLAGLVVAGAALKCEEVVAEREMREDGNEPRTVIELFPGAEKRAGVAAELNALGVKGM